MRSTGARVCVICLFAVVITAGCHHQQAYVIDWHGLRLRTDSLLVDSAYKEVYALDSFVYNSTGKAVDNLKDYLGFSLNCVAAENISSHSDIYRMLRIIQQHLHAAPDSVADSTIITIAGYYSQMGLYRRAYEVFAEKKDPADSMLRYRDTLARILTRSESAYPTALRDEKGQYVSDKASLQGRLCDVLTAAPENGWYDERQSVVNGSDSLMGYTAVPETSGDLFAFLTGQRTRRLAGVQTTAGEQGAAAGDSMPGCQFKQLELDETTVAALPALVAIARADPNSSAWLHSETVQQLIGKAIEQDKDFDPQHSSLFNVLFTDNTMTFALYSGLQLYVFIIRQGAAGLFDCYARGVDELERISLEDVLGNGKKQLLVTASAGSSGSFDAEVVDLERMADVFTCIGLYHGTLAMLDLDGDNTKELITMEASEQRIVDCNQCPSRYTSVLYDYDSVSGKYVEVASNISASELLIHTNQSIVGLSPLMMRAGGGEEGGGNIYALLDSLNNGVSGVLSDNMIEKIGRAFYSEYETLNEVGDNGHAVSLERNMLNLFDRGRIPLPDNNRLKLAVYECMMQDMYMTGDDDGILHTDVDRWYHNLIDTSRSSTSFNNSMRGLAYLDKGRFGNAFDCFRSCYQLDTLDPNPAAAGNMALYFSIIDDTASYYTYALEAVDKAIQANFNVALNLFHVAKASAGKLTDEEQLDYMIRAIHSARGARNGEQLLMIMEGTAQIALQHQELDLTLKLLDQAIAFSTTADWEQMGAFLLLLYSQCLEQMHMDKEAGVVLATAIKLAKGISKEAYISGCYTLSNICYRNKDADGAFYYSKHAFDSIGSFRKSITELTHKFSFLTDKRRIAEWYVHLLQEQHHSAPELFTAMDAWKMQSFIDAYRDKGIYSIIEHRRIQQTLPDSLASILSPADMLVDFSINSFEPFAIVVTKEGGLQKFPVAGNLEEIRNLVNNIHAEMDVNNPKALEFIREDKLSGSLSSNLSDLYTALFSRLEIPAGIKRMIIIPDEVLYGVPWSALKMGGASGGTDYFMDRFEYTIFPSAAIAYVIGKYSNGRSFHAGNNALVLAALEQVDHQQITAAIPALSGVLPPDLSFDRLSNGEEEAKKVAASLEQGRMNVKFLLDDRTMRDFSGTEPKEPAMHNDLLRNIKDADLLHFISHGIFNRLDPTQSCLFIEQDSTGNRLIMPKDLADSNLGRLSLVSLSACQTGINNLLPGSEPIGFLRCFLGAGTAHVVLTDWEVDDKTTSALFERFYALIPDKGVGYALNEAKRTIRKVHPHPFFWSGITLYGKLD